jgi:DNA-binding CsgD family transcriptional regulator
MFYYGFYYTVWRAFPIVQSIGKTWGSIIAIAIYLAIVFFPDKLKHEEPDTASTAKMNTTDGKEPNDSGVTLVIGLHLVYYTIMCMINYIEWSEKIVYSLPYGLGQFASIVVIALIMLIINHSALHIWVMYLVFSFFGLTILIYDSSLVHFSGSLIYGLGDGLGYIIIYYLCSGAIKRNRSYKMYRLYCLIFFIEYFFISGILSFAFEHYTGSNHYIALGVVLVLCSASFLLLPLMQKRLFKTDWTDGLHLRDIEEYTQPLAETEKINIKDDLNLTAREHELLTLLLKGLAPKEIAYTLKVSYHTVSFHRVNLYRKLGIQSRAELFARFLTDKT